MDVVHTDQRVWVSWVMSKEVRGKQWLRPLSCQPRNTVGAVPNLSPHKGGPSAPTAPPTSVPEGAHQGAGPALPETAGPCTRRPPSAGPDGRTEAGQAAAGWRGFFLPPPDTLQESLSHSTGTSPFQGPLLALSLILS